MHWIHRIVEYILAVEQWESQGWHSMPTFAHVAIDTSLPMFVLTAFLLCFCVVRNSQLFLISHDFSPI